MAGDMMQPHSILFAYNAPVTAASGTQLIARATSACSLLPEAERVKRRLLHVVVESVQNIFRHSGATAFNTVSGHCMLVVTAEHGGYAVISGNPIRKANASHIVSKIEEVNALNREGLTDLYRRILRDTRVSIKGGAGLGFVDIARRSGKKLFFDFQEISEDYCFFRLKVFVPGTSRLMSD